MTTPTRRHLMTGFAAVVAGRAFSAQALAASNEPYAADPTTVAHWMDEWIGLDRRPVGPLHLGRFADPMYFLLRPIRWEPNSDQKGYEPVTVPAGFVTDFASIPRIFWSLLRPDGQYTYPAIVHDYLYWTQNSSKQSADSIFKFGMEDLGIGAITTAVMYYAVDTFGQSAWQENARLRAAGEQRILCRYPDDPRTTWAEWQKQSQAFVGCADVK